MSALSYDLLMGPQDATIAELFRRLFGTASLGWMVPVLAPERAPTSLLPDEKLDAELGYTEYRGPPLTAELSAALEKKNQLPPIWCALAVRVPKGKKLVRLSLLRRVQGEEAAPLALLEVGAEKLRLVFPCDGEPLAARARPDSALEAEKWELAARLAREELEAILERMRSR